MLTSAALSTKPIALTWMRRVAPLVIALPLVCYLVLVVTYAVNVPWVDDMDAFLSFILGYSDATTLADKVDWLLRPNNEHRILTAKLSAVVMRALTGEVNFRWLVFVAFGFLFGTFALCYRVFRSMNLPLLMFAPVCFIFWQPQYYLTSLWALTGLQHGVVIFLTLLALYLLSGSGRYRFAGAILVQVLASLSMSNGLFGWLAGAVVLALARQWGRLGLWLSIGVATIVFYFHDFQNAQGNDSSVSFFLHSPHIVMAAFFTFTGALLDLVPVSNIFRRSLLPTLFGLLLVPTVFWFLWRMNWPLWSRHRSANAGQQRRRYFFTGCYTFLFVNAAVVAILRPRFGYDVMLVSNYMIYPALLTALVYLTGLSELRPRLALGRWVRTGLVVSLVVWSVSYALHWPQIAFRKQMLLTFSYNQKHNDIGLGPNWGSPFADMVRTVMRETVRRGIYRYPTGYFTPYETRVSSSTPMPADPNLNLHMRGGGYDYIVETDVDALPQPVGQAAVVIQSNQRTYLFPSEFGYRPGVFYLGRPVRTIWAEVINPILAPGTYRVGLLTPPVRGEKGVNSPIRFSNRQITIP
ncbi:hypothetical protein [Spirosoma utsteinense]|uniref:Glycosyltransferase RgtA/B/C/D-like domain-containing protein n=1 Tax=Spirosoma utsteinense TaxID=2585773 RepID=A0ABR6W8A2_9BACT|nr:hypothetical protein [Spirosoma utsteinense]MBC3784107.1 hypothetical protein [Spirosoma utsteinense]MBC3792804.1 hypothetical protein [Spirosoma utsteinense]